MKYEYRIVTAMFFLLMTSVNGSVYNLLNAETTRAILKYSTLNVTLLLLAIGIGFLFQKLGVKFNPPKDS